jgi:hypothetical protein
MQVNVATIVRNEFKAHSPLGMTELLRVELFLAHSGCCSRTLLYEF